MTSYPTSLNNIVILLLISSTAQGRQSYARYQRGDQGPDVSEELSAGASNSILETRLPRPIGGPNVCRSRDSSFCCPGWIQRGTTGLCLIPVCNGCGNNGRCFRPNMCICQGGQISPNCGQDGAQSEGCESTCLNGGTCKDGKCICRPGYTGEYCQEPVCKQDCENGGRCIGPNRCACVYGYTGRYCEIDYRTGPCYRRIENGQCTGQLEGVVCTRQLCCATIGEAWGHPCEECPATLACEPGFLKNLHTGKCMDINECEAIPDLCAGGQCTNTEGSFQCECPEGMVMDDNHQCSDQDECALFSNEEICPNGRCINKDPGYYCLCAPGYIPSQDQKTCLDTRQGNCYSSLARNGRCRNKLSFRLSRLDCCCGAGMGVAWGESRADCEPCPIKGTKDFENMCEAVANILNPAEVDECALRNDLCPHGRCINTDTGYHCECEIGYQNSPSGSCVDVNECLEGKCKGGRCRNSPGGFDCNCPPGMHLSQDGSACIDHNECEQSGFCANGQCINAMGSFKCECKDGFQLSPSGLSCVDIDECLENPRICLRGRCRNTPGAYICECEGGFMHSSDGGFCMDENECSHDHMCENGQCINMDGGFKCVCDPGYELSRNAKTCVDIDECRSNPCLNGKCSNTNGGFQCECHSGFSLGPDGRTCTDSVMGPCYDLFRHGQCLNPSTNMVSKSSCCCNTGVSIQGWGMPCQSCPFPGSYEFKDLCPHGPGFTNSGNDINECAQNKDICANGACENLIGAYRCICNPGYEIDPLGKQCVDVDECKINPLLCAGGQCKNTPGSYQCACPPGTIFNPISNICDDENECVKLGPEICPNGRCINTKGSYTCECNPGSVLDSSGRFCLDNRRGSCWTKMNNDNQCENNLPTLTLKSECCCSVGLAWGSPCEKCDEARDCDCPPGMAKLDGKVCTDINECTLDPSICQGGICINTDGSFKCRCPPGLTLDASGTSCVDERVEPCFLDYRLGVCSKDVGGFYKRDRCCCSIGEAWGHRCSQCPRPGTSAYDELCPKGPGFVDLLDVNECLNFPNMCQNGRCKNTIGSYSCRCNQGYALDEDGVRCVNINECDIMFGVCGNGTCIDVPGGFTCDCDAGFETTPMMQVCMDINECERTPGLCRGGKCINTPGSFHCECPVGHELSEDGRSCKDIDECGLNSEVCSNGVCENMMGAYQCICDEGFRQAGSGTSCVDIDECADNNGGCDSSCINTPGSYSCTCAIGYMLLMDGRSCKDIDECEETKNPCNGGKCMNTPGSFSCMCSGGLIMGADGSSCLDLDECTINENVCKNGKCENTLGSFKCLCDDGYSIKEELEDGCSDDDECELNLYHCDPRAECQNTNGSYICSCHEGFSGDGFDCQDINECLTNNGGCDSHAQCINIPGSFKCVCDQGYNGDGIQCEDIDECADDPTLCDNGVCLNEQGSFSCECQMGYMHPEQDNTQACIDIDECSLLDNVCLNGECENLHGVYRCVCHPGYTLDNSGGNCTDIDECQDQLSCQYGSCSNEDGSYKCECPRDMELLPSGTGCVDHRVGRCYMNFNITFGGYSVCGGSLGEEVSRSACCCSVGVAWGDRCEKCPEIGSDEYNLVCPGGKGFHPNAKTIILEDINECLEIQGICKNGRCSNTFGSYMCTCDHGFKLDFGQIECIDIDECLENPIACGEGKCVNIHGGFECICPDGYMLSSDGQECIDMRKEMCFMSFNSNNCSQPMSRSQTRVVCCCSMGQAWGPDCEKCPATGTQQYQALCGNGSPGMMIDPLSGTTHEIDECLMMPGMCQHGTCMNTIGSFTCDCELGFTYDDASHQCIDTNECNFNGAAACFGNSRCVNTQGSYECVCPPGYKLDHSGRDCLDVDECSENFNLCRNGQCTNIGGSFQCVCDQGFALTTSKDACMDRDECSLNPTICGNGTCLNVQGSYRCQCHYGFQLSAKGDCEDVDECRIRYDICRNGRCKNTRGSFTCDCPDGYILSSDGQNCEDVDECQNLGICPEPGTCQNIMGSFICTCPDGYRLNPSGMACQDINECVERPGFCENGFCENQDGEASCDCSPGWALDPTGIKCLDVRAEQCFNQYRGRFCMNPRSMNATKQTCCCTKGEAWGSECEQCPREGSRAFEELCPLGSGRGGDGEDFNECEMIDGICEGGTCVNTDGGFRCECPNGFTLDPDGSSCVDENECLTKPLICGNGTCANVNGGFECECADGYAPGPRGICEDIDECREYGHQCAFRCHNVPGSFRCICPFGYTLAPDGLHCMDLNECESEANNCRYECKNLIGSFMCVCPEGYRKIGYSDDCEDIDECTTNSELCGQGRCINIEGGYQCECPIGYEISANGKDCTDRRDGFCHQKLFGGRCPRQLPEIGIALVTKADCCCTMGAAWGDECEICPTRGTLAFEKLCMETGFGVYGQDIDECQTLPNLCNNGQCINAMGSYRCICDRGFKPDSTKTACNDVNECLQRPGPCEHECQNTYGSFICSCPPGYLLNSDRTTCRDVDECSTGQHMCEHECVNTQGSYQCVCPPGFTQFGDRCLDTDECVEQPGLCPPPGTCKNTRGSFKCVCPRGYRLDGSGTFCIDTNECDEDPTRCDKAECRNHLGSYKCGCPDGFSLHSYLNQCEDQNECSLGNNPCGNARCQNSIGSYACTCPSGYQYNQQLLICVQASLGCSQAACSFGCDPVGSNGFSCGCPRGYQGVGNSHCLAINDPDSFRGQDDQEYEYLDEGEEQDDSVISNEGCFACKLNGNGSLKRRRIGTGRRQGRSHSRKKIHRRWNNHNRQIRSSHGHSQVQFLSAKDAISHYFGQADTRHKRSSIEPTRPTTEQPLHSQEMLIELKRSQTKHRRRILFLQPSTTDLEDHLTYEIDGPDKELFHIKRRDGIWGLFYRRRVREPSVHKITILSKEDVNQRHGTLHMRLKVVIVD